jgi:hypothetical protein
MRIRIQEGKKDKEQKKSKKLRNIFLEIREAGEWGLLF